MKRRHFISTLACLPAALVGAAAGPGSAWADDIDLLQSACTQLHPGLGRYLSNAQLAGGFARLRQVFSRAPDLARAYLALSEFLASIRCGHTYANFYNQRRAVSSALFAGRTRLPLHFRWLGERLVVIRNFSPEPALAPGAEILALDGQPAARILRRLLRLAPADGHNDAKRRALMSAMGTQGIEAFDVFQGLLWPPEDGVHRVQYRAAPHGRVLTAHLAAIDLDARRLERGVPGENDAPAWSLSWPDESSARLAMPTWALYDSAWNWRVFLDDAFREMRARRVTRLVVDLRGNEGGEEACGLALLSYLFARPFTPDASIRTVRYRRVPDALNPHLDTWDDSFRDWGDAARPLPDGNYELVRPEDVAQSVITPRTPTFDGSVCVLVDSENSSATFDFARTFQAQRRGPLVGEPTGGNQRGINGGAFFFLRLPRSGLEVDIPLIGYFPKTPQPDAGLAPDVLAIPSLADIRDGTDRGLATALAIT